MKNLETSLIELKNKINSYKSVASDEVNCDFDELCAAANSPHEFILETFKFDTEWDREMMDYLLKATDLEAANYLLEVFLPKFEDFMNSYAEWCAGDDVVVVDGCYLEHTTQWNKRFSAQELMKFYVKEYCFEELKLQN